MRRRMRARQRINLPRIAGPRSAIRRASQGLFSISDRDQAASGDTEGGRYYPRASDPNKRVRVVVTIDYLLE